MISFFAHFFPPTLRAPAGLLSVAPLTGLLLDRTASWALPFVAAVGMHVAGAAAFAAWAGAAGAGASGLGASASGVGSPEGPPGIPPGAVSRPP